MLNIKSLYHLFLFFFALTIAARAQEMMPPINNYATEDYGSARQNWGVSTDDNGILYVANNDGLLRFDDMRWDKFYLPNKTIIRSVLAYKERIYTGSYEEFGYWSADGYGGLGYTSLKQLIDGSYDNEEFWQITPYKDKIAFRSFGQIFIYDGEKIEIFTPKFIITSMLADGDRLLVGSNNGGLYEFNGKGFDLLAQKNEDSVITIVNLNGEILVGTRFSGIFSVKNGAREKWGTDELRDFLVTNELNKMVSFKKHMLIMGTVKGGLVYYDLNNKTFKNHHRKNGLLNNTVLSLETHGNQLWAGLDNGIAEVRPDSPIKYYIDYSGELGAVYDIVPFKDKLYLGTNTGVHSLDGNNLEFIQGSQGQVWNLEKINDRLIVNHNRGVYEIRDDKLSQISLKSGSYNLTKIEGTPNLYLNPTYNGIFIMTDSAGIKEKKRLKDLEIPVNKILFESSTVFWASHPYNGLYRVTLDDLETGNINNLSKDTLFTAYRTSIHKIKNDISFYNDGKWYKYNAIKNKIEPFKELGRLKNYGLLNEDGKYYWFKNRKGKGMIITDFAKDSMYLVEPLLENRMISNYDKVIPINDSIALATMNEGFASINYKKLLNQIDTTASPAPLLREISDSESKHMVNTDQFKIEYKNSTNFDIKVSPAHPDQKIFYYELSNGETGYLDNGELHLNKLASGKYAINIYALSSTTNKKGLPLTFSFTILRPWYTSTTMILIYGSIILLSIYIVFLINKRKLNRHRTEVEQKLMKEQERKTQLAEHNRLMDEIKNKRKELANSTFQAAKRNRTLIEIKNELDDIANRQENKYKIKNLKSKINHVLEGRDNWKVFEENFNELHDDFFHDLLKKYPKLSTKDLKLCAYLKMNLSSKEIAPLMSISVRGVEIHRYRLRKKLQLDSNENLSKFLITNY